MFKLNISKIKKTKKFISGQSRYCQNCGVESIVLVTATPLNKNISALQYCEDCNIKNKKAITLGSRT